MSIQIYYIAVTMLLKYILFIQTGFKDGEIILEGFSIWTLVIIVSQVCLLLLILGIFSFMIIWYEI